MKKELILEKIYKSNISHSVFLDKKSVIQCMNESYDKGFKISVEQIDLMCDKLDNLIQILNSDEDER